jgi:agmatinase
VDHGHRVGGVCYGVIDMIEDANFGNLPAEYCAYASSRVVILPVPFEQTASWRRGANRGAEAIVRASAHMELFDIETASEPYLIGIHTARPVLATTSQNMLDQAYARTARCIDDGKFVIAIGGEHSIAIGPVRAHHEHWPGMSVLHLDAHSDRRNEYQGTPLSHACVMARVAEFCPNIVSVGIRSMDSSELDAIAPDRMFPAHAIHRQSNWQERVIEQLAADVYVSIDLDVFDPGIMPSTGTPEPGGLDWYQVTGLLRKVAASRHIVGADVSELCPSDNPAPDFLGARLIYFIIGCL